MSNCLVTKLKETVDDDKLYPYDSLVFKVKNFPLDPNTNHLIVGIANRNYTIKTKNGSIIEYKVGTSSSSSVNTDELAITQPGQVFLNVDSIDTTIVFPNLYDIYSIYWFCGDFDTKVLRYSDKLIAVNIYNNNNNNNNIVGCLNDFLSKNNNITEIQISKTNITGHLTDIATSQSRNTIRRLIIDSTQIGGDIAHISSLSALEILNASNTNITGSIDKICQHFKPKLTYITLNYSKIGGDISPLSELNAIVNINLINNTNVTGDITNLRLSNTCKNFHIDGTRLSGSASTFKANNPHVTDFTYVNCPNITA